jgi:multiple sugar transport system substrate-binding protein
MMKKLLVLALIGATSMTMFANGTKETASQNSSTKSGLKDITLKVYARAYTYQQDDPWKTAEKKLQASHPEINLKFEYEGFGWADLRTKFLTASSGGQAPDVVMTDIIWLGEYADAGLITDVTKKAEAWSEWSDVVQQYKDATKWKGKIYGTWLNTDVRVMAYNKKLFREAGLNPENPPQTWSELRKVAKQISDKLGPAAYGLGFPATLEDETAQTFYTYLYSLGGQILTDDMKHPAFNSDAGVKALTELVECVKSGATPESIVSGAASDVNNGVFQDKFAMSYMTKAFGLAKSLIKGITPEQYMQDFGVANIPRADNGKFSTMSGGYLLCVPSGSKNQDLAWEFIENAAGAEAQFGYTKARGYVPTFKSLMDRSEDYYAVDPYFKVILDQLNYAHFRPSILSYTEMSAEVQNNIQAAIMGVKTPKQALDDAAKAAEKILNR